MMEERTTLEQPLSDEEAVSLPRLADDQTPNERDTETERSPSNSESNATTLKNEEDGPEEKRQRLEAADSENRPVIGSSNEAELVNTVQMVSQGTGNKPKTFPSLLEFVESEIWARNELQWRYPTTSGFAQEVVDLGLCESVKQAKKEIRQLFETMSDFSTERVVERFLSTVSSEDLSVDILVARFLEQYGGAVSEDMARGEIQTILGLAPDADDADSNESSTGDEDEQSTSNMPAMVTDLDEMTKSVLTNLASNDILKAAAKKCGLNLARMPNVKSLQLEPILDLIEQLDAIESSKVNSKIRRDALVKLEKKARFAAPLTYQTSKYPARAVNDLLDLALVASATRFALPEGVRCIKSSHENRLYTIGHPIATARFRPFAVASAVPQRLAWFSTTPLGAAYVLKHGHPFPGLDREVILHGKPRRRTTEAVSREAKAWVLFRIATNIKHCGIEDYTEDDDDLDDVENDNESIITEIATGCEFFATNQRVHVYDMDAMCPLLCRLA